MVQHASDPVGEVLTVQVRWLQDKLSDKVHDKVHDKLQNKWVVRTRAWVAGMPEDDLRTVDKCMVCEKPLKRHRNVAGDGRVCSPECALVWTEKLDA
ncbi:hypothetical protein GCM10012275_11160 [Longimycelium tulufanense]|uniref:Uncharacterized protein n=1 Tax=Longimycelium tulufanense TaxID=907463 RepID=A0A8J3CB72_9PSEU|nr:hypothetical protein [Longimycelium tulufanense]GGM41973.1 hypothetical protein GCM10012275_11160 [Longimycelium tulufanense]